MAAFGRYLPIHEITQRRSPDREQRLRATKFCELSHSWRKLRATGFWQALVKLVRVKPHSGLKRTAGVWPTPFHFGFTPVPSYARCGEVRAPHSPVTYPRGRLSTKAGSAIAAASTSADKAPRHPCAGA